METATETSKTSFPSNEEIARDHRRAAYHIARKFFLSVNKGVIELEDLVQIALIAMMESRKTFRPEKDMKWLTHAYRAAYLTCLTACNKTPVVRKTGKGGYQSAASAPLTVSLSAPVSSSDSSSSTMEEQISDNSDIYSSMEKMWILDYVRNRMRLTEIEKTIIEARFLCDEEHRLTFMELGRKLGYTHQRIEQIEKRLLERIRKAVNVIRR